MPKSLIRDRTQERAKVFVANVEKYQTLRGKSDAEVGGALGIEKRLFQNRKNSPRLFSLTDIIMVMDYLQFSPADRAEVAGVEIKICEIR